MMNFQKLLFPVDFSSRCAHMAPYTAGIVRKFNSELILLHCFDAHDPFGYGAMSSTTAYGVGIPALWDERETLLADFAKDALQGFPVERVIEGGEPGETISRYIRDHNVDLVAMPTHGYSGFRRVLMGSVTSDILHKAHCPVWTTAHSEALDNYCAQCIKRIVCGVDLQPTSNRFVQATSELAQQYSAKLRFVHAVGFDMLDGDAPFQRFLLDTAVEKLSALQKEIGGYSDACAEHGEVAQVIRRAAIDYGAQLVIVGRGHATERLGSLRTTVNAIARESPCPVLSL